MNPLSSILSGARMAGQAMKAHFSNPATLSALGTQVALDTAVGAATQQVLPRLVNQQPQRTIPQSLINAAVHSGIAAPISSGMEALGVPASVANLTGQIAATPLSHAVSNIITPESHQQPYASGNDLMQMQQYHADLEQQRYNNEIALAMAKNYRAPTEIVHRNPSADLDTMYRIVSANSPQYG